MAKKFLDFDYDEYSSSTQTLDPSIDRSTLKRYQNEVFTCLYHINNISNKQKEIRLDRDIEVSERRKLTAEYDTLYKNQRKLFMDCLSRIKKIDPNDSFLRTVLNMQNIDPATLRDIDLISYW